VLIRNDLTISINFAQCCGVSDVLSTHCVCGCAATHQYPTFQKAKDVEHNDWGFMRMVTGEKLDTLSKSSSLSLHVEMLIREKAMQVLRPLLPEVCIPLPQICDVFQLKALE
jgi:hypothetical protein